ncbi:hypothetical protein LguiA_031148 [Lonicera macranthoides]
MHHLLNQHQPKEKLIFATSTIKGVFHRQFYSLYYEASEGTNIADAVKLNLNFPVEVDATEILGSSNGLLCIAVRYQNRKYSNNDDDTLICNPSPGDSKLIHDTHAYRAYNIYVAHPLVRFSYDSSIDDGFGHTQFLGPVCLMRNGKIRMLFNEQWKRSRSQIVKKFVLRDARRNNEYFRIRRISRRSPQSEFRAKSYDQNKIVLQSPIVIAQTGVQGTSDVNETAGLRRK